MWLTHIIRLILAFHWTNPSFCLFLTQGTRPLTFVPYQGKAFAVKAWRKVHSGIKKKKEKLDTIDVKLIHQWLDLTKTCIHVRDTNISGEVLAKVHNFENKKYCSFFSFFIDRHGLIIINLFLKEGKESQFGDWATGGLLYTS